MYSQQQLPPRTVIPDQKQHQAPSKINDTATSNPLNRRDSPYLSFTCRRICARAYSLPNASVTGPLVIQSKSRFPCGNPAAISSLPKSGGFYDAVECEGLPTGFPSDSCDALINASSSHQCAPPEPISIHSLSDNSRTGLTVPTAGQEPGDESRASLPTLVDTGCLEVDYGPSEHHRDLDETEKLGSFDSTTSCSSAEDDVIPIDDMVWMLHQCRLCEEGRARPASNISPRSRTTENPTGSKPQTWQGYQPHRDSPVDTTRCYMSVQSENRAPGGTVTATRGQQNLRSCSLPLACSSTRPQAALQLDEFPGGRMLWNQSQKPQQKRASCDQSQAEPGLYERFLPDPALAGDGRVLSMRSINRVSPLTMLDATATRPASHLSRRSLSSATYDEEHFSFVGASVLARQPAPHVQPAALEVAGMMEFEATQNPGDLTFAQFDMDCKSYGSVLDLYLPESPTQTHYPSNFIDIELKAHRSLSQMSESLRYEDQMGRKTQAETLPSNSQYRFESQAPVSRLARADTPIALMPLPLRPCIKNSLQQYSLFPEAQPRTALVGPRLYRSFSSMLRRHDALSQEQYHCAFKRRQVPRQLRKSRTVWTAERGSVDGLLQEERRQTKPPTLRENTSFGGLGQCLRKMLLCTAGGIIQNTDHHPVSSACHPASTAMSPMNEHRQSTADDKTCGSSTVTDLHMDQIGLGGEAAANDAGFKDTARKFSFWMPTHCFCQPKDDEDQAAEPIPPVRPWVRRVPEVQEASRSDSGARWLVE